MVSCNYATGVSSCSSGSKYQKGTTSSNGCGTTGLTLAQSNVMTPCCNEHDHCYGTAGKTQKSCDDEFLSCMLNKAGNDAADKALANSLYGAFAAVGSVPFCVAQTETVGCQ
uniref:Phospholipase A2 domain-containing protein n=1 Tax=Eutreptiella gymnastica TaxID=73025 RepID=A0A6T2D8V7_9EUGL|eukprot:CAMPEP_0174377818 /NCGR_PEP_ID=MMETSP0811_2-20130205/121675_1 /TAXON_ID=73025 ORGANISM="Eutreptiella gymnastica-like, Strain CCMP1594" /NCGR_SAMPLE_ID=MMETSP0811_2 /ASSEMBLY_ACC=CAM_ASM_000667 /LENGTH=111 /DNA_ID=CAMNT_0015529903 /DNA_START=50 /DNA_END=385 /DNA_ORIENTATION=-